MGNKKEIEKKNTIMKESGNKVLNISFIILFVLLLLLPAVTMPFFANAENTEKRELAQLPSLYTEEGKLNLDITNQFDDYVMDHIGFRSSLVEVNSKLYSNLFHQSSEESIVLGTDGWLYYENTINDYLNIPTLTERNVNNVAHALLMMQEYVNAQDSEFVVALIPNKNSLYSEHMPYNYLPLNQDGNLELLQNAFARVGVHYADVQSAFKAQDEILYQRLDSHWNYKGARLGYQTIFNEVSYPHNNFENFAFIEREDWEADLATMLYSTSAPLGVQLYPDYEFGYEITSHEKAVDSISLQTYHSEGNGSAVVYRDSFTNTMQVYVAESFENAFFSRAYPYQTDLIIDHSADVTIIELIERNLINLAKRSPIMPAQQVSLNADATSIGNEGNSLWIEKSGGYIHFYGEINENVLGSEYQVYLLCSKNGQMNSYEAFPIFEQELMESDVLKDNGFSMYLPADTYSENKDMNDYLTGIDYYIVVQSGEMYITGKLIPEIKE